MDRCRSRLRDARPRLQWTTRCRWSKCGRRNPTSPARASTGVAAWRRRTSNCTRNATSSESPRLTQAAGRHAVRQTSYPGRSGLRKTEHRPLHAREQDEKSKHERRALQLASMPAVRSVAQRRYRSACGPERLPRLAVSQTTIAIMYSAGRYRLRVQKIGDDQEEAQADRPHWRRAASSAPAP